MSHEAKTRLLFLAGCVVFKARAPLYSCLTVSQLVSSCGTGSCCVASAGQTASGWLIPYRSQRGQKVSRMLCGISGSPKRGGCVTAELSACSWGLVKRTQEHVDNGTSQAHAPGYRAVPCLNPIDWHDMLWGAAQHVDTRKQLVSYHSHHGQNVKLPPAEW